MWMSYENLFEKKTKEKEKIINWFNNETSWNEYFLIEDRKITKNS